MFISEAALVKRINRRMRAVGHSVRLSVYGSRTFQDFGRCYVVDDQRCLAVRDVDLEQLGREWHALRPSEGLTQNA